jgi:hypothetical protein
VAEHTCSFQGPLGQHFVTFPYCCPCLSCVPRVSGGPAWLAQRPGMNPAFRGSETGVPAQPRSLWPQWVGWGGAGAGY